jgi:hypothetical protein
MKLNATCQHIELPSLTQRLRTAGGHVEIDGKEAVCGRCGLRRTAGSLGGSFAPGNSCRSGSRRN